MLALVPRFAATPFANDLLARHGPHRLRRPSPGGRLLWFSVSARAAASSGVAPATNSRRHSPSRIPPRDLPRRSGTATARDLAPLRIGTLRRGGWLGFRLAWHATIIPRAGPDSDCLVIPPPLFWGQR